MDPKLKSIILLGLCFMILFTAAHTIMNIQKTILYSIQTDDPSFKGDGYTNMAVICVVFSVLNCLSPAVISMTGPKIVMVYGGLTYLFLILQFLWPQTWLLYFAGFVVGTGTAVMWTGKGYYLTVNSTPATISRNAGIFWTLFQMGMFGGNLFVYFQFRGLKHIDKDTRTIVITVLAGIATVGIILLSNLPRIKIDTSSNAIKASPLNVLKGAIRLLFTKNMLLLSFAFIYAGAEISFFTGIYSACIGFTNMFGAKAKQLVGLSGIFIGLGEVTGGILVAKFTRWGRPPVIIGGLVVHLMTFFLIFLNLPNSSPHSATNEDAFISSSAELAILCSFLLGLGDAFFLTQIISILGELHAHNSASAFAVFKFVESITAATYFASASRLGLHIQLGILVCLSILGTATFVYVERREMEKKHKLENSIEPLSTEKQI